uniref:C-type lectin domain-containing protein n=1 Tax=Oncorhynchus tshawytscha TaxID=74940 RepID=A0AAZ3NMH7_ONCTS
MSSGIVPPKWLLTTWERQTAWFLGIRLPASAQIQVWCCRGFIVLYCCELCILCISFMSVFYRNILIALSRVCVYQGYSLVSLNTEEFLLQVTNKLREMQGQVWIGLRRSSLTGQWYWLSKAAVSFSHWAQGEPGNPIQGQCAMMTLDPQGNYTWSDQSCCEALPAVCYREPLHFPLQ